jgi:hypothetical protein
MKDLNFILSLLLVFICHHKTLAQEIRVVSKLDNSPLPYATVTNHSRSSIVSCDDYGIAHLSIEKGDTLTISHIGYKTVTITYSGNLVQIIYLIPQQVSLPTVTVRTCKETRELTYRNFTPNKKGRNKETPENIFGGVIWTKGTTAAVRTAVRLNPLQQNAILKNFSFWLERESEAPESSILNPLILGLYEVSDSTYLPGEFLLNKPIFYFPTREGKQTIELDTFLLRIPPNGIYVSLQYVMNEAYEWKKYYFHTDSLGAKIIDTVVYRYGGIIKGLRTENFDFVSYDGISGKWSSVGGRPIPNADFHSSIMCEATLKVCEEISGESATNLNSPAIKLIPK